MSTNFIPLREDALLAMSLNFKSKVATEFAEFSLTSAQSVAYAAKHDAFASALATAQDPATRSPMNVELKNVAKRILIAELRLLAGIVQRAPNTTNAMRIELMLTPRDGEPTPIGPPAMSPTVLVKSNYGNIVMISLIDAADENRRARPAGVDGATIMSHIGETTPADISDWKMEGSVGRMNKINVVFDPALAAGTKVWLTAFYFSPRKQSGVAAVPISVRLTGGVVAMSA